jgi:hypothetical protein
VNKESKLSNPDEIRQLGLSVGNAINVTAQLAAAQTETDPVTYFAENVDTVVAIVLNTQARARAEAGLGAIVVEQPTVPTTGGYVPPTAAPTNVVPFQPQVAPQPAPQQFAPVAAPAPIPLAGNGTDPELERYWQSFFQAVNAGQVAQSFQTARDGQWFDNRAGKSAKAPDFKVKGRDRNEAVWIGGKGNPAWVAEGLRQVGLA